MHAELATANYMSKLEARKCANDIKASLDNARELIVDLYERKGWRALGYPTFRDCVSTEFGQSKTTLYRQLEAGQIEREFSQNGKKLPDAHLKALAVLPAGERREAYEEAVAVTDGKPTAAKVREIVDHRLARVNGHASPDPPDVAKARANGKIPAAAVVEVVEPETETEPIPEAPVELDDAAWLAELPLSSKVKGSQLKTFQQDALVYRQLEGPRNSFRSFAAKALKPTNGKGEYAARIRRFLKVDHPKTWLPCPSTENGGCGGTGAVPIYGECPKCRAKGYWIQS